MLMYYRYGHYMPTSNRPTNFIKSFVYVLQYFWIDCLMGRQTGRQVVKNIYIYVSWKYAFSPSEAL